MIKTDRYLYGTVKECVMELVKMIDCDKMEIPDFDFATNPYCDDLSQEYLKNTTGSYDVGDTWYGCKNVSYIFDGGRHQTINLLFGYWGGGSYELVNIDCEEKRETDMIVDVICGAIYNVTGDLAKDDMVVFDFEVENCESEVD